jgi:hypothetical protein
MNEKLLFWKEQTFCKLESIPNIWQIQSNKQKDISEYPHINVQQKEGGKGIQYHKLRIVNAIKKIYMYQHI